MPIISLTSKKQIEVQHEAITRLQEKCTSCKLFREQIADEIFTYSISREYSTDDRPAMVAIARYKNTYAIYAPNYLTKEQFVVFEFLLRDAEPNDTIVVFSKKSYDAVKKYSYKPINVKLYV